MRPVFERLGAALAGVALALAGVELVLRLLPTNEHPRPLAVNAASPVPRFEPDREFTWSKGWDFRIRARKRANADGFLNRADYRPGTHPLLAVVGDSYVEAAQVDDGQALHGRLAAALAGRAAVYSFGASYAQLPTYLAYAEYARDRYRPDAFLFVIVGNDFDESLRTPGARPGYTYFDRDRPGALVRLDYAPSWPRRLARRCALARYLFVNVGVSWQALAGAGAPGGYVGHTAAAATPERLARGQAAADEFFRQLPLRTGLDPSRLLLVVDGLRPALYDDGALAAALDSFFGRMRRAVLEAAAGAGVETVDLQPWLLEHYRGHQKPFEFDIDGHWNGLGHRLAAEAVAASASLRRWFPEPPLVAPGRRL